jgi:hypothetical protein
MRENGMDGAWLNAGEEGIVAESPLPFLLDWPPSSDAIDARESIDSCRGILNFSPSSSGLPLPISPFSPLPLALPLSLDSTLFTLRTLIALAVRPDSND